MSKGISYKDVYIENWSSIVGPMEAEGPLQSMFDGSVEDLYAGSNSYEQAEVAMVEEAYHVLVDKLQRDTFDIVVAGDLMNQLGASHYFARDLHIPFVGVYAACSNSTLALNQASLYLSYRQKQTALVFTSSHYANAEKQFRFPNEYGIQKKETVTTTVTGAGCIALTNQPTPIQITHGILGEIYDADMKDANDMGSAMVMAAYTTIVQFFAENMIPYEEVDHIFTGDLSSIGLALLKQLLIVEYPDIEKKLSDCGLLIYDIDHQNVFAGGSGCACSMCTMNAYILPSLLEKKYHKVLIVATGALLNPIMVQQKESIPCIAHGILLESMV